MNKIYIALTVLICHLSAAAQEKSSPVKANYTLAAKFSPEKLKKLIFSTTVNPNWINHTDRFWYEFTSPQGKKWYVVNPASNTKEPLFDPAEMAAKITKIVQNPFDAQHLELQNLRFTEDEKKIKFEVRSTKDTVKSREEIAKLKNKSDTISKKTFYLEYTLATKNLLEIKDTISQKRHLAGRVLPLIPMSSIMPKILRINRLIGFVM